MSETSNLTNTECIFYVLYTFSTYSDNNFNQNECVLLNEYMKVWQNDSFDFEKALNSYNKWNKLNDVNSADNIKEVMSSISEHLNKILDISQKEALLMQIRIISYSDGVFHENERRWHDLLAKILGLDLKVSSQKSQDLTNDFRYTKRKSIGFKASWNQ